ncbi:hypothetical protein Tco_0682057 [Tanacetum coccineum]|uniref:Uncharacterized protein n=1 Tax=Tanacetum coccineum TaxID=301880 RepID=A0ABQ4XRE5_9ASTR
MLPRLCVSAAGLKVKTVSIDQYQTECMIGILDNTHRRKMFGLNVLKRLKGSYLMEELITRRLFITYLKLKWSFTEHLSDTKVLTMKMETLLEQTSNKLLVTPHGSEGSRKDGDGDTSFQWSQFTTPCSHLMLLIKDIMTNERPTTQLPQL